MLDGSTSRLNINTVQTCSGNAAVWSTLYVDVIIDVFLPFPWLTLELSTLLFRWLSYGLVNTMLDR